MTKPLKVLIVEDSANDAELIAFELRQHGYQPTYERVATAADMLAALARQIWEVVISDYIIPDFGGKAALEICQLHGLDIPFICVSGIIDEGGAVEMIRAGAHDFVSKLHLSQLGATVERELQAAQRRAELRQEHYNKAHLAAIVENSSDAIIGINLEGGVLSWNRGAEMIYGYAAGEMIGQPIDRIMPPHLPGELAGILERIRRGERIEGYETLRVRKDRQVIPISLTVSPIKDRAGQITGTSSIARDITELKQKERALQAALAEREQLVSVLQEALNHVKTLQGLLPICAFCHKIRNGEGKWERLESYITSHTEADFTHGFCPECGEKHYGVQRPSEP